MNYKKSTVVFFLTKIIIAIIGVVSLSIQTRYITPEGMGVYSLIIGISGILTSIFIGWVSSSALRYYDKNLNNLKSFYSTLMIEWAVMITIVILIIIFLSYTLGNIPISDYLILLIIVVCLSSLYDIFEKILRSSNKLYLYSLLMLLQNVVNVGVIIFFAKMNEIGVVELFWAKIFSVTFFLFFTLMNLKIFKNIKFRYFSPKMNKNFMGYGLPMIGVWGISWHLNYSDRIIINFFYSPYEVGIYDTGYRLSESALAIIISSFVLAFFPPLIQTWNKHGEKEAIRIFNQLLEYYLILIVPAVVGMYIISPHLFGILIDNSYLEGLLVVQLATLGMFFMGLNSILYKIWQLEEKTKKVLAMTIISVVVNLVLNIIFLPIFGYKFAAITTVFSYAISTLITIIILSRKYEVKVKVKSLVRISLSSTIMSIALFYSNSFISNAFHLMQVITTAVVIYFLSYIILGGFRKELTQMFEKYRIWRTN